VAYRGELSVAEVIECVPGERRAIIDWTRDEIERGLDVIDSDDPRMRDRRARSLDRLRAELQTADAGDPSSKTRRARAQVSGGYAEDGS
jgi:hypothetical protein